MVWIYGYVMFGVSGWQCDDGLSLLFVHLPPISQNDIHHNSQLHVLPMPLQNVGLGGKKTFASSEIALSTIALTCILCLLPNGTSNAFFQYTITI